MNDLGSRIASAGNDGVCMKDEFLSLRHTLIAKGYIVRTIAVVSESLAGASLKINDYGRYRKLEQCCASHP